MRKMTCQRAFQFLDAFFGVGRDLNRTEMSPFAIDGTSRTRTPRHQATGPLQTTADPNQRAVGGL